jgi:hypothetical protein
VTERYSSSVTSPGTGILHGVRALLLAAVVVGLSLVAHRLAGGSHPGVVPLVVLAALTAVAVRPAARHEIAMPRLVGLLGAGQVVLHVVFEQCALLSVVPGAAGVHDHPESTADPLMIAAHVVATFVVALVLRHGEGWLWRLWAWLTARRLPGSPAAFTSPWHLVVGALRAGHGGRVPGTSRGRGPPVAA